MISAKSVCCQYAKVRRRTTEAFRINPVYAGAPLRGTWRIPGLSDRQIAKCERVSDGVDYDYDYEHEREDERGVRR